MAPQGFIAAESTPSITSDNNSGNAINGNAFVLNGSNFGTDFSSPMGRGTFEGQNLQVDSGYTTWTISRLVLNHGTTSQYGSSSNNAMLVWNHGTPNDVGGCKNGVTSNPGVDVEDAYFEYPNVPTTYKTLYFYLKRMRTFDSTWTNWKTFRLFNPSGSTPDFLEVTPSGQVHPFNGGNILLNATNETIDSGNNGRYHHALQISTNVWNVEQFIYKQKGGDNFNYTSDGDGNYDYFKTAGGSTGTVLYYHFINGSVAEHNEAGVNGNMGISDILIVDNYEGFDSQETCIPSGNATLMDDVTFATGAARVMIATSSVLMDASKHHWAFGNQLEYEPVTFWSSTSVVFTAYSDTFTAGQTVYAYVFDSSNNANSNGYAITWGITSITNLNPVSFNISSGSFASSWTAVVGANFQVVMATSSDFTHFKSSGSLSSNTTAYPNLGASTQYYFEVKVATEADGSYQSLNLTTLPDPVITPNNQLPGGGTSYIKGGTDRIYDDGDYKLYLNPLSRRNFNV